MRLGRDGIAGLILLGSSLALLGASFDLPSLPLVPVGPGFYPRIVLSVLAAASVVLVLQDIARAHAAAPAAPAGAARRVRVLVAGVFAVVGAYVFLMPLLGFRVATVLFVGGLQAALEWPRSTRQWTALAVVAVATSAVTYLVFERYLLVLLPRGRWTGF
ncbi:MAG: tripartite tricarboxylate transporter TctB family protein [Alphaproteobacteria bacterium]|nr:tripartite tricarboxylate transporter TctB family protein [Alphaproteobacteria bacterium]